MLDMGTSRKQNDPDWFDVVRPTKLPSFEDEFGEDGHWFAGVRQSRLGVKAYIPTDAGRAQDDVRVRALRHRRRRRARRRSACATPTASSGEFGAGQTWSPFMDIDVFPNSIEYWGPNGMVVLPQRPGALDADPGRLALHHRARAAGRQRPIRAISRTASSSRTCGAASPLPTSPPSTGTASDWGYIEAAGHPAVHRVGRHSATTQFDLSATPPAGAST